MEELTGAKELVAYYMKEPPVIRDRTVYVQFSNYDHLKTENPQVCLWWCVSYDETLQTCLPKQATELIMFRAEGVNHT